MYAVNGSLEQSKTTHYLQQHSILLRVEAQRQTRQLAVESLANIVYHLTKSTKKLTR